MVSVGSEAVDQSMVRNRNEGRMRLGLRKEDVHRLVLTRCSGSLGELICQSLRNAIQRLQASRATKEDTIRDTRCNSQPMSLLRKQVEPRAELDLRPDQCRQVADAQDVLQAALDTWLLATSHLLLLLLLVGICTRVDGRLGLGLPPANGIKQVATDLGVLGARSRCIRSHRLELLRQRLERSRERGERRDRGVGGGSVRLGRSRQKVDTGTFGEVVLERARDGQEDAVFRLVGEADRGAARRQGLEWSAHGSNNRRFRAIIDAIRHFYHLLFAACQHARCR